MTILTIVLFVLAIIVMGCISDSSDCNQAIENEKAKKESREAVEVGYTQGEKTTTMLCTTVMVGIILYWTRNILLVPIIELYTAEVDMGMLFMAVVLSLISVNYICAVYYKLSTIPYLAISFVLNCVLASKAPIVSMSIVFIFAVCVYGVIKSKNTWITVLESALIKAMIATSVILTILNVIGIIPSIIILLIIMAFTTSISITIEVIVWKKVSYGAVIVDAEEVKETGLSTIITRGMVPLKQ